jgi:transposase-like protein
MGITLDGERDVLGLWAGPAGGGEGARAWMGMLSELKNRGVQDVLMGLPRVRLTLRGGWVQAA